MTQTDKELVTLQNRINDLAQKSYSQNCYTFTGFLGLSEQTVFFENEKELQYAHPCLFGGNDICERKVLRFGNEELFGYEEEFPISLLEIRPLQDKFADDLGHRDFLGSIMNLGIERSTIGDIFIKDKKGYVFCLSSIKDYLMDNLNRIRHTSVMCVEQKEIGNLFHQEMTEKSITAASERIDGIICKLHSISRGDVLDLFREGRIFINGRVCTSNSKLLKQEDSVTIRGKGKFIYKGVDRETRKGKLSITVLVYE